MRNVFLKAIMSVALVSLLALGSCAKQRDVSDDLEKRVAALEATSKELGTRLDAVVKDLAGVKDQLTKEVKALDAKVVELKEKGATKAELDAAKKELLAKVVTLEAFNDFKTKIEGDVKSIKADLDKKADKSKLTELEGRVQTLETWRTTVNADIAQLKKDVEERKKKHDELEQALKARLSVLEGLLKVAEEKSEVLDKIQADLTEHAGKIASNTSEIETIKKDLTDLTGKVTKNKEDIAKLFSDINRIDGDIKELEGDLDLKITEVYAAIAKLASEVRGLTFIPTRGLYEEKTAKLYYYADDYTALHTLIFQVSPSTAKLGTDFTVEGLQYQMTTRADEHDAANIDIVIDGEVTQEGDRIYVPVRIKNTNADPHVYGMYDAWWNNKYFYNAMASMQLEKANFPQYVVDNSNRTFKETEYNIKYPTEQIGQKNKVRDELTLDGEHNTFTAPKYDTPKRIDALSINLVVKNTRDGAENTIKASEYVHANLIPVQIKLAWNNPNKSGSLESQLLPFTQVDAVKMANKVDGQNPLGTNWHATLFRGQISANGQNFDVAPLNLDELVQSYYYPADGADFSNEENVATDPFRSFYNKIGTFGKPETDKPAFAEPEYKYEIVAYKDTENEVIGGTHIYAKIVEGNKLVPIKESHRNANDKKLIVRVTQTNSELAARQPIGYLVIKMTEQTENKTWNPVEYTIDSAADKKYLITCANGGTINTTHVKDGTTYDKASALYFLQLPEFNTIGGNSDFKNAPYVLGGADYVTAPVDEYDARNAKLVERDLKFEVAANNLITDVTPEEAWKHIAIRFNKDLNKYVVTVKDNLAPAGTYTGTFKLRHLNGVKQAGPDLYLTFKFEVAINDVKAKRDGVNWSNREVNGKNTQTYFIDFSRIANTNNRTFLDKGYVADLTQAFVLKQSTQKVNLAFDKTGEFYVQTANEPPCTDENLLDLYNLRFEFSPNYKPDADTPSFKDQLTDYKPAFDFYKDMDEFTTDLAIKAGPLKESAATIVKQTNNHEWLPITDDVFGDMLYNYLIGDTKPGKERVLWVRLVADVVYDDGNKDVAPEGRSLNRVEIDVFPVMFQRALQFRFEPIELKDNQTKQTAEVVFNKLNTRTNKVKVQQGLFVVDPFAADERKGHEYVVAVDVQTNASANTVYGGAFGLQSLVEMPIDLTIEAGKQYVDYEYIQIYEDGSKTWATIGKNSIYKDYRKDNHANHRWFAVERKAPGKYEAQWQGDNNALTQDLKFRVAVVNKTAIRNGVVEGDEATLYVKPGQKTTITFRHGHAKVYSDQCWAYFTIKKQ